MSELVGMWLPEFTDYRARVTDFDPDPLLDLGYEIVNVSLGDNNEVIVETDPWLFKSLARDMGYDIEHGEALLILEEVIQEKSHRATKQAKILQIAGLYFNQHTAAFDVGSFKESYLEEFSEEISDEEVDTIVHVMQQYNRKDS